MSYIAEYRDKILSGEIIAGRYIHLSWTGYHTTWPTRT